MVAAVQLPMGVLCMCTFVCLGALGLNSICVSWIWALGSGVCVCVLILSEIMECLLWALPLLLVAAVVHLPRPGRGTMPGESHKPTKLCGSPDLAGEGDSVQAICGIFQEWFSWKSSDFWIFGFALWTVSWAVGAGSPWDTPTAPFSGPAPLLLNLQQAPSSCTISLAPQGLNSPGFAEKINLLRFLSITTTCVGTGLAVFWCQQPAG